MPENARRPTPRRIARSEAAGRSEPPSPGLGAADRPRRQVVGSSAPSSSDSRQRAGQPGGVGGSGAPPRSGGLPSPRRRGPGSPRWPRRLVVIASVICLLLLVAAGSTYGYVRWRLGQIHKVNVSGLAAQGAGAGSPMTILITGSDTRAVGGGKFGSTSQVSGQRSDVIMLARLVPATKQIALLSIPRDTLVNIPGVGFTRINAAFGNGPALLIKTIDQDFGIQINHYVGVNFQSFEDLANAIGGVEQYFPTPARDLESGLNVTHAGCVNLLGAQALAFVRSRNYQYYLNGQWNYQVSPESDLGRIQRQQAFIKAAVQKAKATGLTNPIRIDHIVGAIVKNLTVDNTFTSGQLIHLAITFRHVSPTGIQNWTLPTVNSDAVPGALDTVPSLDHAMIEQFLTLGQTKPGAHPGASSSTTAPHSSGSPASSTPPTTTVQPGDSSYVNGQYVPPGRVPGQKVPNCGS